MQLRSSFVLSSLLVLSLSSPAAAALDCNNVKVDGRSWNLKALGGRHSVMHSEDHPPVVRNTNYVFDICNPLPKSKCPKGTSVCGVERVVGAGDNGRDWKGLVTGIIPIAGDYHAGTPSSRALDPKVTTLKSGVDSRVLGLRVELHGGQYPFDLDGGKTNSNTTGRKQTAIIDLQCDPTRPKPGPRFKKHGEAGALAGHREEGASQDDSWPNQRCEGFLETSTSSNSSHKNTSDIRFISYGPGGDNNNNDVLHLEWLTKYACENINNHNDSDNNDENDKSSHWGFFTWVIIIVILVVASYFIFGAWLNYSRYGGTAGAAANGWDALPHADTLRDIPYILREWWGRLVDAWHGNGLRGGYSAV